MMRVATAALLCCGAAAQDVSLNGTPLDKYPADTAVGKPFSDNGVISMQPSWLSVPFADYFRVPAFDSDSLTLTPEGTAPSRGAETLACGMGWAKNEAGESECFTDIIEKLPAKKWGWTNKISEGEEFKSIPVYIGASQCEGGHHRHNIRVKFSGTTIEVDLSDSGAHSLRAAQVYVGEDKLPVTAKGAYSNSPGGFPVKVNVNDDPVVRFEGLDASKSYYFAVHVNSCDLDRPACPSTFYVATYQCAHAACTDGVSGNLPALLVSDGWTALNQHGPCFQLPETGDFNHETYVFSKELDAPEDTPATAGPTNYVGVYATGCDEALTPPTVQPKPGPVRRLCKDNCPPGSAGYASGPQ